MQLSQMCYFILIKSTDRNVQHPPGEAGGGGGLLLLLLLLFWSNLDGEDGSLDTNDCIPVITLTRQMPDGKFPLTRVGLLLNLRGLNPPCNLTWP